MTVLKVSTTTGLNSALLSARGGDTIELAAGVYDGFVFINRRSFDAPLTIRSADPDHPATFSGRMMIKDSAGVSLESLDFRLGESEPASSRAQVHIIGSKDVALTGVTIEGRLAKPGEGVAPEAITELSETFSLIEGHAFGDAVSIRNSAKVTLSDVEISKVVKGVGIVDSEHVAISDSHLHHIRRDGVVVVSANDISITDSLFDSFQPFASTQYSLARDHADFIQFHNGAGLHGIDGLTISRNAFLQGDGGSMQGIFGRLLPKSSIDGKDEYTNFTITDNVINTSHPNALILGDVKSAIVTGNLLIPAPIDFSVFTSTNNIPRLMLTTDGPKTEDGLRDFAAGAIRPETLIADNLFVVRQLNNPFVVVGIQPDALEANGVVTGENTSLSSDPANPAYFGAVFPDLVEKPVIDLVALLEASPVGPASLAPWIVEEAAKLTGFRPGVQSGGAGDDVLTGGAGIDVLYGQAGSDTMTGGARGDVFSLTGSAPGAIDEDVITDLDFEEGDTILLGEGFPGKFFRDDIDADNAFLTIRDGSVAVLDSDADIEELLATSLVSLGDAAPGDVRLDFDLDGDGAADYRLLLEGYDRRFTDRDIAPLIAVKAPASAKLESVAGLPLYEGKTVRTGDKGANLIFAGNTGSLLEGGPGNDTLVSGVGDDVLVGGSGSDRIVLGAGADRVVVDVTTAGDIDEIYLFNFSWGHSLELFFPVLPDISAMRHIGAGSTPRSLVVLADEGIFELSDRGLAEIVLEPHAVHLIFSGGTGGDYTLALFDYGSGSIRAMAEARANPLPGPDQILALPDFAAGDVLLIDFMPAGYFSGSGLPAPAGVTDGSAVEIASVEAIRALLLARPDIHAVPDGADRISLRFTDAGEVIATITLTDLGAASSYKIAFGDPGAATRTGGDGNDRIAAFAGDGVLLGGAGDDFLRGVWNNDWLDGGSGDDTLVLDYGNDVVIGGAGADTFSIFGDSFHHGDHDIIADLRFEEGDTLSFSRFPAFTFEAALRRGTVHEVSSVEGLAALADYGFTLARRPDDAVVIGFETQKGVNTVEIHLDPVEIARFDELFGL